MKDGGLDSTLAAVVLALLLLCFLIAHTGCNGADLTRGGSPASPTPSVAVTVTPPPCPGGTPVVSPPPNVTITSNIGCGNANKAVLVADPYDGDGNAYLCIWLCTTEPGNASPHEVLQTWDLSADDGDGNTLISSDSTLPCCTVQP